MAISSRSTSVATCDLCGLVTEYAGDMDDDKGPEGWHWVVRPNRSWKGLDAEQPELFCKRCSEPVVDSFAVATRT